MQREVRGIPIELPTPRDEPEGTALASASGYFLLEPPGGGASRRKAVSLEERPPTVLQGRGRGQRANADYFQE